ncbi:MAG: hypothetical protein WCC67_07265 [Candidatus Acidiferrales bacterium]
MNVNAAIRGNEFAAENGLDQIIAADDNSWSSQEESKEIEFDRGQIEVAVLAPNGARAGIQFNITEDDWFWSGRAGSGNRGIAAPQDGLNTGGQFAGIKRLHQVIVRADFETVNAIGLFAASREHDHGEAGFFPDAAKSFEAFDLREHDIQYDQSEIAGKSTLETVRTVIGYINLKAFRLEVFAKELAKLDVIVHNENAG